MSVEYPELPSPQTYCDGSQMSCDSRFLGLYLSPANTSTTNGPCGFGVDVDGGGTLGDPELAWVSSSGQTSCAQCGSTFDSGSSPTFTDAVDNNIYNGTMWFTYTIMKDQGFLRKANPGPSSLADSNTDLVIYPNPTFSEIHLVINTETIGEDGSLLLFNEFGKEVYQSSIIAHDKQLDIRLPNLSSCLYLIKVFNSENEVGSKKFVVL